VPFSAVYWLDRPYAHVLIARAILIVLVCASPALAVWEGLIAQGILAGVLAIALAITARSLRPGEAGFLASILPGPAVVAAIPAVWMGFQALPLNVLAHPMWQNARVALGHSVAGSISIDPGATVIALGQYLCLAAVAFLSAAVAVDRGRAASVLFALTAAATVIAILLFVHDSSFSESWTRMFGSSQLLNCAAMGPLIAGAACLRTIERSKGPSSTAGLSAALLDGPFLACALALAICATPLLTAPSRSLLFATGYGLLALFGMMIVRRFELGLLGVLAVIVPALGLALLLIAAHPAERNANLSLAFAGASSAPLQALSERMLDDLPVVGTGAGTFASLAPIYREMSDPPPGPTASTAAATLTVELGRPMFWFIVAAVVGGVALLSRASLRRGRDSFYPALGAGCLTTQLVLAFSNAGLMHSVTGFLLAVSLGLALAQSKSRVAQ
jgi:hypothetical protein